MPVRKLHTPDDLLAAAHEAKAKWLRKEREAQQALRAAQTSHYLSLGKVAAEVGGATLDAATLRAILLTVLPGSDTARDTPAQDGSQGQGE